MWERVERKRGEGKRGKGEKGKRGKGEKGAYKLLPPLKNLLAFLCQVHVRDTDFPALILVPPDPRAHRSSNDLVPEADAHELDAVLR